MFGLAENFVPGLINQRIIQIIPSRPNGKNNLTGTPHDFMLFDLLFKFPTGGGKCLTFNHVWIARYRLTTVVLLSEKVTQICSHIERFIRMTYDEFFFFFFKKRTIRKYVVLHKLFFQTLETYSLNVF